MQFDFFEFNLILNIVEFGECILGVLATALAHSRSSTAQQVLEQKNVMTRDSQVTKNKLQVRFHF